MNSLGAIPAAARAAAGAGARPAGGVASVAETRQTGEKRRRTNGPCEAGGVASVAQTRQTGENRLGEMQARVQERGYALSILAAAEAAVGQTASVSALVQAGANLEARSNNGNTALMGAAYNGQTEAVSALVQAGANLEATNKNGNTALILAAYKGHTEAVSALVHAGADIEATNKNGNTALMAAAVNGKTEAVTQAITDGKQALMDEFQAVRKEMVGVSLVSLRLNRHLPSGIQQHIQQFLLSDAQNKMAKKYIREQ